MYPKSCSQYTPNLVQNIPHILFKIYPKCVPIIHNMPQLVYTYHFAGSFCWSSIPFWPPKPYPKFGVWNPKTYPKFEVWNPKKYPKFEVWNWSGKLGSGTLVCLREAKNTPISRTHSRPQIWGIFWDSRPQIWGMFWDSRPQIWGMVWAVKKV